MGNSKVQISPYFYICIALILLVLPLPWILAVFAAAFVHECFHILALICVGGRFSLLQLHHDGARIALPEMSRGREMVCALAGPIGSLSLLLFSKWLPRIAFCGAMQAAFNLLPIYPLDGGRALRSVLALICPPPVSRFLYSTISIFCKASILILAFYGSFWLHLGVFPIVMASVFLLRTK